MISADYYGNTRYFNEDGNFHKPNGPAVIWWDGECNWYLFGELHRYYGAPSNTDNSWRIHGVRIINANS
jgi:hypothetical protein